MEGIAILLAVLASLIAGAALLFTSQATVGVAIMAGACLLAIFARLAQASHHNRQTTRLLERILQISMPPPDDATAARLWQCQQCGQFNGLDVFSCARCQTSRSARA
jgi:hypothetical protein